MRKARLLLAVVWVAMVLALTGCGPRVYNNGTYKGVSQADDHGYAIAEVVVEKDRIVSAKLTEITELGVPKDYAAYPYAPAREANAEMSKRFAGRKDANADTYAGATSSSSKYKEAVAFALEKARKSPEIKTAYFEGTFFGKSKEGPQGYGIAWVAIKADKIVQVRLEDVTSQGELKDWLTYEYAKALEAKHEMEKRFTERNSAMVDAYTGATRSSTSWIEAVADALANAKIR